MRQVTTPVGLLVVFSVLAACDAGKQAGSSPPVADAAMVAPAATDGAGAADAVGPRTAEAREPVGGPDAAPAEETAVPPAATPKGAVGSACKAAAECAGEGATCLAFPGGYCAIQGCAEAGAADCPEGSACFYLEDDQSTCLATCTKPSECRQSEGYTCDADGTCWPDEPAAPAGPSPIGGPCQADEDCADPGATCYPDTSQGAPTGFVGGYCMKWDCKPDGCPDGATCLSVTSDGATACLASCAGGSPCPQAKGYVCSEQSQETCWPGCSSDAECPAGTGCHPEEGFCVAGWSNQPFECTDQSFEPNDTKAKPALLEVPFGQPGLDLCTGEEDWFQVAIPKGMLGTVGASFVHVKGDLDLVAYDGDGKFLGSRTWYEDYGASLRQNESGYEYLSIMSLVDAAQGIFRVRGYAGAANTYDLEVLTTEWVDDLICIDHFGFDECRGYTGKPNGKLYQFPFPDPNDPYVPAGYGFDSYGSYRWLRRELIMLVRYAIHEVQQKFPGTGPLGLIDMADKDAVTPGYDVGDPRHPESTHDQGGNLDIAYYQSDGDSSAEVVCGPDGTDTDGYWCTSVKNHIMDVPRTTYFMAMIAKHPRLRVIGVDQLLAPLIEAEAKKQSEAGYYSKSLYQTLVNGLAYGEGWPFHHHHMHVSMRWWSQDASPANGLVVPVEPPVGCGYRMPGDGPLP
jgi:hypothetical protein